MRVHFDPRQPLGGIGLTPWMRVGPERWFNDYRVVVQQGWGNMPAASMNVHVVPGGARSTQAFAAQPNTLAAILSHVVPGPIVTSHPIQPIPTLHARGYRLFAMNQNMRHLENKVAQRQLLADIVPFAPFSIVRRSDLTGGGAEFTRLAGGRQQLVLQDESLGGGRGTYIIATPDEYNAALSHIAGPQRLVASAFVAGGRERSVHGCVTQYGTIVGPMLTQIVRDPQLANMQVAGAERFCGGQVTPHDSCEGAYPELKRLTRTIGDSLRSQGYCGIFGVDFLVAPTGHVYVLEVNPRFTGLTPLLTQLWRDERDVPFYLLHILETCGLPYHIKGLHDTAAPAEGGVLVLYNQFPYVLQFPGLTSGVYRYDAAAKKISFVRPDYNIATLMQNEFLLERRHQDSALYKPGARFAKLYFGQRVLGDDDSLLPHIRDIVAAVYDFAGSVSIRT